MLTAAIGVPLVILSVMFGLTSFAVFLSVVAGMCTYELCSLAPGLSRRDWLVMSAVALSVALALCRMLPLSTAQATLLVTGPLLASLLTLLGYSKDGRTFARWSWTVAGALYVGWLLGHWGATYALPDGRDLVLFGIFTTFFYDTFAYFTGRAFGRHKLAPHLSSGKTWEGVAGGFAMAVIGGLLVRLVLTRASGGFAFSMPATAAVSVCLALAAQTGDLVESAVKRSAGVKDAGRTLPGHGGMLDRFDSLLFVGPVLYYLALWVTA